MYLALWRGGCSSLRFDFNDNIAVFSSVFDFLSQKLGWFWPVVPSLTSIGSCERLFFAMFFRKNLKSLLKQGICRPTKGSLCHIWFVGNLSEPNQLQYKAKKTFYEKILINLGCFCNFPTYENFEFFWKMPDYNENDNHINLNPQNLQTQLF